MLFAFLIIQITNIGTNLWANIRTGGGTSYKSFRPQCGVVKKSLRQRNITADGKNVAYPALMDDLNQQKKKMRVIKLLPNFVT
jgi:parvulin-like peptidyl-prolyl isomerase